MIEFNQLIKMNVFIDGKKVQSINIESGDTIGMFKNQLRNIVEKEGKMINFDKSKVVFNDGNQLSAIALDTDDYDEYDFSKHQHEIDGGKIFITTMSTSNKSMEDLKKLHEDFVKKLLGLIQNEADRLVDEAYEDKHGGNMAGRVVDEFHEFILKNFASCEREYQEKMNQT